MRSMKPFRDPAPSRLIYRLHRLWLRPGFRRLVRFGPPLAVVVALLFYAATNDDVRGRAVEFYDDLTASFNEREEFRIARLDVTGARGALRDHVIHAAQVTLPVSSLKLDLVAVKSRIEALSAVETATVRIAGNSALQIDIVQRRPAALWRQERELLVLDKHGAALARVKNREDHPVLPLLLGDGASAHVAQALEIVSHSASIYDRVRGLERIGNRRWDLILDRNQTIMLPEENVIAALAHVSRLHEASDLLSRDIVAVDMRDLKRPVLRLGATAIAERKLEQIIPSGGRQ